MSAGLIGDYNYASLFTPRILLKVAELPPFFG